MNSIVLLTIIVLCIIGGIIGLVFGFLNKKFDERRIKKNAIKVLKGEKKNITDMDGKLVEVTKLKVRYDNGDEVILDMPKLLKENA